ncbi:hypothetical protein FACS1894182_00080 [Bacteroidia bacterium]|nr:hypothetical protein FACS1894182_00080 [Bacteroidia bacterium]
MRNEHLEDADLASIGYHSDGTLQCYPRYVRFSHDLSCNHRCTMCRPDFIVNSKERNEQLDALIPTHLLPMLKDASDIALNGEGELFASKHCRNFVRKITEKYPDIFFSLHTNGTLCDEKNMQELGILNRLKHVEVSIHAATEKTYRTITRSDHFHRVWKNVEYLAKLKKEGKLKSLELIFVVQALNYIEMKAFLQRAIDLDCIAKFWIAKHYENSASRSELYRDNKMLPPEKRQVAYLFNVSHPEWETFIKMLTDSIFDSKHCLFTQTLAKIRKPSLQYRIKNKIKKIAVKIYNKWKTPY